MFTPDQCVTFYSPVKSSVPSLADVGNKENWEHAGEVDIHKILQMLDRDMEADAAGELPVAIKRSHLFAVRLWVGFDP
jgi:hypothetical protein